MGLDDACARSTGRAPCPGRLVVKNESKSFGRCSGAIPWPRSRTESSTPSRRRSGRRRRSYGAVLGRIGDGVHGVEHQVDQHLLDLDPVADDRDRSTAPRAGARASRRRRRASARSSDSTSRTASWRSKGLPLDFVPGEQGPQPADHLARPQVVAADVGEDLGELLPAVAAACEHEVGGVGVGEDRAQRLVDLVRDRAQRAHRRPRGARRAPARGDGPARRARRRGGGGVRRAAGRSASPGAPARRRPAAPGGDRPRRASVRGNG